jgi:hypothetical protein
MQVTKLKIVCLRRKVNTFFRLFSKGSKSHTHVGLRGFERPVIFKKDGLFRPVSFIFKLIFYREWSAIYTSLYNKQRTF